MVKCPEVINFEDLSMEESSVWGLPFVEDLKGYEFLFATLPYEHDDTAKPGSKKAGFYFRRGLFGYGMCDQVLDIDMLNSVKGGDCGDISCDNTTFETASKDIERSVSEMIKEGAAAFVFGGDDDTAYAQIKACYEKYGKMAVVSFGGELSKTVKSACENGIACAESSIVLGARSGYASKKEMVDKLGITAINASEMSYLSFEDIGDKVKKIVKDMPVIILYDVNFMDPACVPAAAKPYPGGFNAYETMTIFEESLVGIDTKAAAVFGMTDYNDPGEVSANNVGESTAKLYAVLAYNIAS